MINAVPAFYGKGGSVPFEKELYTIIHLQGWQL